MAITTKVVTNPKVDGVYQVSDVDLKIKTNKLDSQHNVIITSIDKKRKTARVKTITSLEERKNGAWYFKNRKLYDVRNGNIIVIPKNQLNSSRLSGINHNSKVVPLSKIHYKFPNDKTIFPKRYKSLIHKK